MLGHMCWSHILTSSVYPVSSALQRWAVPLTSAFDHTSSSPPYCASPRPNLTTEQMVTMPLLNNPWKSSDKSWKLNCYSKDLTIQHMFLVAYNPCVSLPTLEFSGQIFLVLISGSVVTNLLHHCILLIWNKQQFSMIITHLDVKPDHFKSKL